MKLSTKLIVAFAFLGIIVGSLTGWQGYENTRKSLEQAAFEKLMAVREAKKRQIESYFQQLRNEVTVFSENMMIVDALGEFESSFRELQPSDSRTLFQLKHNESVESYYKNTFLPRINEEEDLEWDISTFLPVNEQSRFLQFGYIANNPNSVGAKQELNNAGTGTLYDDIHEKYHQKIKSIQEKFGLYDVFLVEEKTGNIVYSVSKEVDFATSLLTGPYRHTSLAMAFRDAAASENKDFVKLVDFAPYAPSYNAPTAFIASPIFRGTKRIGVLIFQISPDEIDEIMTGGRNWEEDGLGKSGESFIVGSDYLMRNNFRFLIEEPARYFQLLRQQNVEEGVIFRQKFHKSTILLQKVESKAATNALAGRSATELLKDYWGVDVLSSYAPLKIEDVHWAILSEIDLDEIFMSLGEFQRELLINVLFLLFVIGAFSIFLSRKLTAPLKLFVCKAAGLQMGDYSQQMEVESNDELGEMAKSFNKLAKSLQKTTVSKDYFDNIIHSMNDALLVIAFSCDYPEKCDECEAIIQKVNDATCKLFGYSEEELVGQSISRLMENTEEEYVFSRGGIHELLSKKTIVDKDTFCFTKGRKKIPILFSASVLHTNSDSHITEIICIIHDITKLRTTEENNRILAKFPDENPNPILRVSQQGEILYANDSSVPLLSAWEMELGSQLPQDFWEEVKEVVNSNVSRDIEFKLGILRYHFLAMPIQNGKEIYIYGSDVTEKKQAEDRVLQSEANLNEAQRIACIGNWTWDVVSGELYWSDGIYQIFGLQPQAFKPTYDAFLQTIHPDDRGHVVDSVNLAIEGKKPYDVIHRVVLPDGMEKIVHEQGEVSSDKKGTPLRMIGTVQDVTNAKKAEERLMQSAKVFESSKEAISITTADGTIIDVNKAYTQITGFSREEVLNKNPRILKSGKHDKSFYQNMWQSLLKTGEWQGEIWDRRKNGEIYPKWLSITSVQDDNGNTSHYVGIFSDLTQVKQTEDRIRHLTNYDILTGLPNKVLFRDRLEQLMEKTQQRNDSIAVLFIDLDDFKTINDSLGIQAGDELLIEVSKRLKSCVTDEDTVARFSADDFAIILTDTSSDNIPLVTQWTIDTLAEAFNIQGEEVFITMSIGIAVYPNDGDDVDTLLQNAIAAMNFSRKVGTSAYNFFSSDMNDGAAERLKLAAELRHAVEREEFVLHYQPRVDIKTGKISGMEALIRWNHPEYGLVPPFKFIPLSEETELIVPMTEWIFKTAFKQTKVWMDAGFSDLKVGINLSSVHFQRDDLVDNIVLAMQESGLAPEFIDLELTESIIMQDVEGTIRKLHDLKNLGCMLAIDDFGTGYSSLSYLKRFPIDILKIDQAFIRELTPDSYDAAIAKTIIVLAHSLKLKVIAEGVETIEHLDFLREENCDEIQGYYFSKPLPVDEFTKLLESGKTL